MKLTSVTSAPAEPPRKKKKGPKVEGVWVKSREGCEDVEPGEKKAGDEVKEEDEMIWWSWDGSIVGFSDW